MTRTNRDGDDDDDGTEAGNDAPVSLARIVGTGCGYRSSPDAEV